MDVFIFNADILCNDCGNAQRRELEAQAINSFRERFPDAVIDVCDPEDIAICLGFDPAEESDYDSDQFPKGPYGNGGGESDTPQHCGSCGAFLDNPLTDDGRQYVAEALVAFAIERRGNRATLYDWARAYGDQLDAEEIGRDIIGVFKARG